jgi:hypothetical protein
MLTVRRKEKKVAARQADGRERGGEREERKKDKDKLSRTRREKAVKTEDNRKENRRAYVTRGSRCGVSEFQ